MVNKIKALALRGIIAASFAALIVFHLPVWAFLVLSAASIAYISRTTSVFLVRQHQFRGKDMAAGTTAAAPGTSDPVPVSVTVDANMVSFQFDLLYSANLLTPGTPVGGSALADQQLASAVVTQG